MNTQALVLLYDCCCFAFCVLLVVVFGIMAAAAKAAPGRTSIDVLASPTVLAHRGSIGMWPESTLFTFANTLAMNEQTVLEMDLRFTSDGNVVVLHDSTTTRTCNIGGPVHEKTLAEVQALDAGYWWGTGYRDARGAPQNDEVEW